MTNDEMNRLWDSLRIITEKIEKLSIETAINTESVKEVPAKISAAINKRELAYAGFIILGFIAVFWFIVQVALPKVVDVVLPQVVENCLGDINGQHNKKD